MELKRLKREVLRRHADELEAVLGEEKMLEADAATTVARFHELVTMQVCGDEPDDEMRYRCENSTLQAKAVPQTVLRWLSAYCSGFGTHVCVRARAYVCVCVCVCVCVWCVVCVCTLQTK
jgi:hypothetical protein